MKAWKVTMHCRGHEEDWPLDDGANSRIVLARDQIMTLTVLGEHAFSATLELPAKSALLAIVEGLVLINRELPRLNMPDWPAVEICAEPVDQGSAATQAYGATGCT